MLVKSLADFALSLPDVPVEHQDGGNCRQTGLCGGDGRRVICSFGIVATMAIDYSIMWVMSFVRIIGSEF